MKTINEIQNLLSTISDHNTDGLRPFLLSNPEKPLIAVGSGGMEGVAKFAALLYGSLSGLGRGMTPLEMNSLSDETLSRAKVLLLSAGGHNKDIEFAACRCLSVNPAGTACICLSSSERNKLMPLFEKAGASSHDFRFEAHSHDGFVSCGTPIIYCALLAKAFGADVSDPELGRPFPGRYSLQTNSGQALDLKSIAGIRHFTILHGSWGTPVASLLEGKFTESGWATCQVADFRNYCHGRFIFTSNHLDDSAVVLLLSPREKYLAGKIRSFLPSDTRLIVLETSEDSPAATLDLLIGATGFFQKAAETVGVNPESPKNLGKVDKRVPMGIPFTADLKKTGPLKTFFAEKSYLCMSMHPKYIIAGNPLTGKDYLRMGMVINHKDLRIGFEKVWGGGWWARNDETRTIVLYGSSCDFGSADFRHLNRIDRELKDYTIIYTPIQGLPGNPLDLSDIEWV